MGKNCHTSVAISQTNPLTKDQKAVLDAVKLKAPKRYLEIPTPTKT